MKTFSHKLARIVAAVYDRRLAYRFRRSQTAATATLLFTLCLAGSDANLSAKEPMPVANSYSISLTDFKLTGDLNSDRASFTLNAIANVENPKGDSLELLSGAIAL